MRNLLSTMLLALTISLLPACGSPGPKTYRVDHLDGRSDYMAGDSLQITTIIGSEPQWVAGGTYEVRGRYTLSSRDSAVLGLLVSPTGDKPAPEVSESQFTTIQRGSGTFALKITVSGKGEPFVAYFPVAGGEPFVSRYFRQ